MSMGTGREKSRQHADRIVARDLAGETREIVYRIFVCGIGDRPHDCEGHGVFVTDLRHGRPLHLDAADFGQALPQLLDFAAAGEEFVTARYEPLHHSWGGDLEELPFPLYDLRAEVLGQKSFRRGGKLPAQHGIGSESGLSQQRHLVTRIQRTCVHVVLYQLGRNNNVPDCKSRPDCTRDTAKYQPGDRIRAQ